MTLALILSLLILSALCFVAGWKMRGFTVVKTPIVKTVAESFVFVKEVEYHANGNICRVVYRNAQEIKELAALFPHNEIASQIVINK